MGVMSDLEILAAIKSGEVLCYPFNPQHVKGASIDVTLGEYFFVTDRSGLDPYYNMYSERDVKRYFGEPMKAIPHSEWCDKYGHRLFEGIAPESLIIVLGPGERILAHTHEFVGIDSAGTTQMQARSSIGRNGIVVCKDAGWGDPGYRNRWTMEIQNDNHHHVVLVVGTRVAQIVCLRTGPVLHLYKGDKYDTGNSLEATVQNWSPEDMLPKLYLDTVLPLPDASVRGLAEYKTQRATIVLPGCR